MYNVRNLVNDFINHIENQDNEFDYDYIVLPNTKTVCLFYGIEESKSKSFFDKVVSFDSIDIISENFKDKKVLIADFMMWYGIATAEVFENIRKYFPEYIHILVEIKYIEVWFKYFPARTEAFFEPKKRVTSDRYFKILKEVVRFIYSIKQPYLLNEYGFEVTKEKYLQFLKDSSIKEIEIKDENSIFAKYVSDEKLKYFDCTSIKYEYITSAVISTFPSKNSDRVIIVPHVELIPLTCEQVDNIWESLNNKIKLNTTVDKYKAIKAILSFALYKKYFNYNSNETTWVDTSFVKRFIKIIDENIDFSSIFELVGTAIGKIVTPNRRNINASVMQRRLVEFKFNDMYINMMYYLAGSFADIDNNFARNKGDVTEELSSVLSFIEKLDAKPIAMHELLSKASKEERSYLYTLLLNYYYSDCIMPRIYVENGFVETFLDIYYC